MISVNNINEIIEKAAKSVYSSTKKSKLVMNNAELVFLINGFWYCEHNEVLVSANYVFAKNGSSVFQDGFIDTINNKTDYKKLINFIKLVIRIHTTMKEIINIHIDVNKDVLKKTITDMPSTEDYLIQINSDDFPYKAFKDIVNENIKSGVV